MISAQWGAYMEQYTAKQEERRDVHKYSLVFPMAYILRIGMEHRAELQDYIDTVIAREGSDIHLVSGTKPLFRVRRELIPFIQKEPLTAEDVYTFLRLLLATRVEEVATELKERKQLLFSYRHATKQGIEVNFRVNTYLERGAPAIALRLINETDRTVEELRLPPLLKHVLHEPSGLFLIAGPAGNGKSTTLAAMVNYCNTSLRKHLLTIEDPIEFIFKNKKSVITQREVPDDVATFRLALDNALRADADVLMIGEMREVETMRAVMTAAEVGHLVLSTVHAGNVVGVVHRIIDAFPDTQQQQIALQLADSLIGICSIRLLPDTSGGLVPACELLFGNSAARNLIRERRFASLATVIQTGREEGMVSLEQSIAELVKTNAITMETGRLHATDEQALLKYL